MSYPHRSRPRPDRPWVPWALFVAGVLLAVVVGLLVPDDDDDRDDDDDDGLGRPVAVLVVAA